MLEDNLKELGYSPQTNENNRTFIIPDDRISRKKFVAAKITDSIYFLATDSYTSKAQSSTTFTGLYSAIYSSENIELRVHMKDWADFFLLTKKRKTGIKYIDDHVSITSPNSNISNNLLDEKTVDLFIEINKKGFPYKIVIENDYIAHISELKNKKIVGIETNDWVFKTEDLKNLLSAGQELISGIKSNVRNQE